MKSFFNLVLLNLMCLLVFFACKKTEEVAMESILDCHEEVLWDSLSINNQLVGKWEWQFITCFWNPEDANGTEYKGLTVEFKTDKTLEVHQDGQLIQTSTWSIRSNQLTLFNIWVSPPVEQISGFIYFCEDLVIFSDSYRDGCDNDFTKTE